MDNELPQAVQDLFKRWAEENSLESHDTHGYHPACATCKEDVCEGCDARSPIRDYQVTGVEGDDYAGTVNVSYCAECIQGARSNPQIASITTL